jgi:hypothetical protein
MAVSIFLYLGFDCSYENLIIFAYIIMNKKNVPKNRPGWCSGNALSLYLRVRGSNSYRFTCYLDLCLLVFLSLSRQTQGQYLDRLQIISYLLFMIAFPFQFAIYNIRNYLAGYSSYAIIFYSGDAWFQSRTGNRLS